MYKIFTFLIAISLLFFVSQHIQINGAGQCNNWCNCGCEWINGGCYSSCDCCDPCPGPTCGNTGGCDPGSYVCNRPSGCCPYDTATPPPSNGGGGCTGSCPCTVNCSGTTTCQQTAATNLTATYVSPTSVNLTWTPGSNGNSQNLWVSTNSDPQAGCAGTSGSTPACPVRKDAGTIPLDVAQNSFAVTNLLTPNTMYYWAIQNVQDANCTSVTYSQMVSSCTVSPSSLSLVQGSSQTLTSNIASSNGIQRATFTTGNSEITLNPAQDTTYSYQTQVTAVSPTSPTATITTRVYTANGNLACTQNSTVTVTPPGPWWQVVDADVTSNTDITSSVPSGSYFGLSGTGGYPGIPAYLGSTDLTTSNSSSVGWIAQSGVGNPKIYDYQYFNNQVPDDTIVTTLTSSSLDQAAIDSNTTPSHGYYWYRYTGAITGLDLNVNTAIDVGTKKVILLVDSATVNIAAPISLTDGQGSFIMVVGKTSGGAKGNITINPSLGGTAPYDLEGLYVADGVFSTGAGSTQLKVRGSVVGYDGVNLQRDLGSSNATTPGEQFTYAADQVLLFSSNLGTRKINWKEVAP